MTPIVLVLPLLAAFMVMMPAPIRVKTTLALAGAALTFIAALFLPTSAPVEMLWLPGLEVYFLLDPAGAASVLVAVAAFVMIPTLLYAANRVTEHPGAMLALLLAMQAGLNGVFLAKDLVLFYIFWEVTLIPSLLMLGVWGGRARRQVTVKYLLYAVTGSFLMLVAILALRPLSGAASYRIDDLLAVTPLLDLQVQLWLFTGFALAFAVKLPLWPLHSWLPDFHEQNHPSGVADVAGTLYKVGGWGFFAWALPLFPDAARAASPVLMGFAAFTAVYAAMIAISQTHLKRLLAYASLSHMGVVGVGVFGLHIAGLSGAMYLLAAQMVTTGGLFLISGMLYERRGSFELDRFGGLAKSAPALAAMTLLILFGSIGVPGLANFPGEFMSLLGAFQTNAWLGGFATLAVIAAGIYGVNLYQRLYQGKAEHGAVADVGRLELLVLIPLIAATIWLGVFPSPQLRTIEPQSELAQNQLARPAAERAPALDPAATLSPSELSAIVRPGGQP